MDNQDQLTLVALAISLTALVVSFSQLLQQILGTAEGYRRFKKEIIGPWAWRAHRRWIWYEFRFETTYITPEIDLTTIAQTDHEKRATDKRARPGEWCHLVGRDLPDEVGLTVHPSGEMQSDLLVSWITFLQALHDTYVKYRESDPKRCTSSCWEPALRLRHKNRITHAVSIGVRDYIDTWRTEKLATKDEDNRRIR